MRSVGIGTTVAVGLLIVVAAVLGVRSVPDIKRYLKMRRM